MIRYNRQSAGIECVRLMQLSFYETESHSCTISGGGVGKQTNQEWRERVERERELLQTVGKVCRQRTTVQQRLRNVTFCVEAACSQ